MENCLDFPNENMQIKGILENTQSIYTSDYAKWDWLTVKILVPVLSKEQQYTCMRWPKTRVSWRILLNTTVAEMTWLLRVLPRTDRAIKTLAENDSIQSFIQTKKICCILNKQTRGKTNLCWRDACSSMEEPLTVHLDWLSIYLVPSADALLLKNIFDSINGQTWQEIKYILLDIVCI